MVCDGKLVTIIGFWTTWWRHVWSGGKTMIGAKRGPVILVTKLGSGRPQKVQRGCRGQGPGNDTRHETEWDTGTTVSRWRLTRPTWLSTDPTTHPTTVFGSTANSEYICNIWRWYKCVVLFNILRRICGLKLVRLRWFSKFKQCGEICHGYKLETIESMFAWHKCNHAFCISERICGMYILYSHILPIVCHTISNMHCHICDIRKLVLILQIFAGICHGCV